MKSEFATRKAMKARFNQAGKHLDQIEKLLDLGPEEIAAAEIGALRTYSEQLLQSVHEFSAYWNVVNTE